MNLAEALDGAAVPASVEADTDNGSVAVDVTDVDRLGVRVRGVTVRRKSAVDVVSEAARLPDALRALPERIEPVEVSRALGGARLRTSAKEIRGGEHFEVDVEATETRVRRTRVANGAREGIEWVMTREQLERLVRELEG